MDGVWADAQDWTRQLTVDKHIYLRPYSFNRLNGHLQLSVAGWNARSLRIGVKCVHTQPAYFEVFVAFFKNGECWDMMGSFDAVPVRTPGGWVCTLCEGEPVARYRSKAQLFSKHVLSEFALWFKTKFQPVRAIKFSQTDDGGSTWVELKRSVYQRQGHQVHNRRRLRFASKKRIRFVC